MSDNTEAQAEELPQHRDIDAAMLAIMQEVGYVQKSGKFDGGKVKYNYAGEADFIEAIRPVMIKHGVTFCIVDVRGYVNEQYVSVSYYNNTKQEKINFHVYGTWVFELTHAASGTSKQVVGIGEGNDPLDKASYKAATGALKYALRQSFLIETGDDPDKSQSKQEIERETKQAKAQTEYEKALAWAEAYEQSYIKQLNDCQSKQAFFELKGDAKKKQALDKIEEKFPEIRARIKEAGQVVAARLGVGEPKETPDTGAILDGEYDDVPF